MYDNERERQLSRLRREDYLWIFYGSIILCNLFGNYYEKEYLNKQSEEDRIKYNSIFEIILILTFFIYIYLFVRNYHNYQRADATKKDVYLIRVLGAIFLIIGILCFIYYQDEQRKGNI